MTDFTGQRVLVSGGTKGIGAATAHYFVKAGATVVVAARTAPGSPADGVVFIGADLATRDGAAALAAQVQARFGGVDVLIHALGGSQSPGGGARALTETHWRAEFDLNLLSAVRLDRVFLPGMIERGAGVIVHVTSIQRRKPLFESTLAYAAAKAALAVYSKGLANEMGPRGIRVAAVAPGFTQTDAADALIARLAASAGESESEALQRLMRTLGGIPVGRPAKPEEVASLIAHVAGNPSLHGAEFVIDGGTLSEI